MKNSIVNIQGTMHPREMQTQPTYGEQVLNEIMNEIKLEEEIERMIQFLNLIRNSNI